MSKCVTMRCYHSSCSHKHCFVWQQGEAWMDQVLHATYIKQVGHQTPQNGLSVCCKWLLLRSGSRLQQWANCPGDHSSKSWVNTAGQRCVVWCAAEWAWSWWQPWAQPHSLAAWTRTQQWQHTYLPNGIFIADWCSHNVSYIIMAIHYYLHEPFKTDVITAFYQIQNKNSDNMCMICTFTVC